jgi:hypothetical protein
VRWNAVQIAVWNRDAENEAGREPKKQDSYWYKAHNEHKGFVAPE